MQLWLFIAVCMQTHKVLRGRFQRLQSNQVETKYKLFTFSCLSQGLKPGPFSPEPCHLLFVICIFQDGRVEGFVSAGNNFLRMSILSYLNTVIWTMP